MKNVVLNWTGSALGTTETSPDRPTFNRLLNYKASHSDWGVYIIVNTDTLDDDNQLIFAEQRAQLEAAGVVVLDTAKPFSELGFDPRLEPYYRRVFREGKGAIAHVLASDMARVAMAWRFINRDEPEPVMYLDVDLDVASLDAAVKSCRLGVLLEFFKTAGTCSYNNNFFYIDANPLGAMFLTFLTDLVVASYQAREREYGAQLFQPDASMVFDYVLSLAGPHTFRRAVVLFSECYSRDSDEILGYSCSEARALCYIQRTVAGEDNNKSSTWCDGITLEQRHSFEADERQAIAHLIESMGQYAEVKQKERAAAQEQKPALIYVVDKYGMFSSLDYEKRHIAPDPKPPTCCERVKAFICCGR